MQTIKKIIAATFLLLFSGATWAANIQIFEPPVIVEQNIADNEIIVEFSVSWDNSWKLHSPPNHDAAWIFMKYRPLGQNGFRHANLHPVENIVMGTDGFGAGSTRHNVQYGESQRDNDRPAYVGVFLSRSEFSVGSNMFENVRLHWDIYGTGIDANTEVSVRVFAIEMVFIPLGEFASIHTISTGQISTATTPAVGGLARVAHSAAIANAIANNQAFPLGIQPFYIMKHEVSQHAWVDFLNSLTLEQQITLSHVNPSAPTNTRFGDLFNGAPFNAAPWGAVLGRMFLNVAGTGMNVVNTGTAAAPVNWTPVPDFRHARMNIRIRQQAIGTTPAVFGINASLGQYAPTATPTGGWDHEINGGNLPMFGLAWTDVMAYMDWAGLRPLTELEFEKAARGSLQVMNNEHAWGTSAFIVNQVMSSRNRPDERPETTSANVALPSVTNANVATAITADIGGRWPIRVGAFARETTSRIDAGASFWGVLNLSDNVAERFVRFDIVQGWDFRGSHGDGNLTGEGLANNRDWPGVVATIDRAATVHIMNHTNATGTIYRGLGSTNNTFQTNVLMRWVSDRTATNNNNWRNPWAGARGGRSTPTEFLITSHPSPVPRATNTFNVANNAQGAVPTPWIPATHTLRVHAVGGELPHTFQWYWTEEGDVAPGELPMTSTAIDGATMSAFLPPHNEPHGPRFFFATLTDAEGVTLVSNISGAHSVLAVGTHPSNVDLTTSFAQGTEVLNFELLGGTPPFTVQWRFLANGVPGAFSTGGTVIATDGVSHSHWPIIPAWVVGTHFTFFAEIRDIRGVVVRTAQSGRHIPGGMTINGPGNQGTAVTAWNVRGSRAGVVAPAQHADHIHRVEIPPGLYSIEAWGASGGRGSHHNVAMNNSVTTSGFGSPNSGWGGYTVLFRRIQAPTTVYVVPGGSGVNAHGGLGNEWLPGGFNGGGQGGAPGSTLATTGCRGGSGGGATHISTEPGLLTDPAVRSAIWLVAGGGGGGGTIGRPTSYANRMCGPWMGRAGGGLSGAGDPRNRGTATGGTQTTGGLPGRQVWNNVAGRLANVTVMPTPGVAGQGGNAAQFWRSNNVSARIGFSGGGGGGWFGGGGGSHSHQDATSFMLGGAGGGGSGHIRPELLTESQSLVGVPASGTFSFSVAATSTARGLGSNAGGASVSQHPQGRQEVNQIRSGAVRILRLQ